MAAAPKALFANFLTPNARIWNYTCDVNLQASKGTLLDLVGDNLVSKAAAFNPSTVAGAISGAFIGVAFADHEVGEGTTIAVLKEGRMDVRASGALVRGDLVYCKGNDEVGLLPAISNPMASGALTWGIMTASAVGQVEETATDGEVVIVSFNK